LNLSDYILKRNGVPIGHNRSLWNNLNRSLGASTNADFWRHWNPIWGYYLGKGVYVPLQRWVPKSVSLLVAFAISGALHDLAIGLVKNWQCFFTIWFILMGIFLLLSKKLQISYSEFPFYTRMGINILSLSACFLAAWVFNKNIFL
jgi:hypothetical protein